MRLDDLSMKVLLPGWMKDNPDDVALANVVNDSIKELYAQAILLTTWDKLDQLPEEVLDRLARELDIDWYETGTSIEAKQALIKSSDLVHAKKGTVRAVETVIRAYFGKTDKLMEWFDYNGKPHHFKVFSTEPTLVNVNLERFLSMLEKIKRLSSKLDAILIGLTGEEWLYVGQAHRESTDEIYTMLPKDIESLSPRDTINSNGG